MNDYLIARLLMTMSLAFHIVFAALGIGMPLLMAVAEGLYLRRRDPVYLDLCRRWSKGTAVLFAVGAVSGTTLSFQLGLLWPGFMAAAGGVIGLPFALEGFAFFTEAIFLGVYLYGWNRLPPVLHWLSGVAVAVSGLASGVFIMTANGWMNAPAGFRVVEGAVRDVDPVAAMLNRASLHEAVHMTLAAGVATGFAVAAVHAFLLLRRPDSLFHRRALGIALAVACCAAPLQALSGDFSARRVSRLQPAKLAAMEAHYRTGGHAPLRIGGSPDDDVCTTPHALVIPGALSLLVAGDPAATVAGLDAFPRGDWPNVRLVHAAFDLMVAAGLVLLALGAAAVGLWWRRRVLPDRRWFLRGAVAAGPLGFLALEAGWVVTEAGRQPWVIYGVMRTQDAVTPMRGLVVPFVLFAALFVFLAVFVVLLLRRQFLETLPADARAS